MDGVPWSQVWQDSSLLTHFLLAVLAGVSAGLVTKARASDEPGSTARATPSSPLMSYAVVPDITASNLNIGSGTNDTSALTITQLGVAPP